MISTSHFELSLSKETRQQRRDEMLGTSREDMLSFAGMLEGLVASGSVAAVTSDAGLKSVENKLNWERVEVFDSRK